MEISSKFDLIQKILEDLGLQGSIILYDNDQIPELKKRIVENLSTVLKKWYLDTGKVAPPNERFIGILNLIAHHEPDTQMAKTFQACMTVIETHIDHAGKYSTQQDSLSYKRRRVQEAIIRRQLSSTYLDTGFWSYWRGAHNPS